MREDNLPWVYQSLAALHLAELANAIGDVTACPGTDSCKSAITASSALGRVLGTSLTGLDDGDPLVSAIRIKISGCPNGCGQHHLAGIGLQGASVKVGMAQVPCYDLYLGGSSSGNSLLGGTTQTRLARLAKIRLPAKRVPEAIQRMVRFYKAERHAGEEFNVFVDRVGFTPFDDLLADLRAVPGLGPDSLDLYRDWEHDSLYRVERGEGECGV